MTTKQNIYQRASMFGVSLDTALALANTVYLVSGGVAVAASLAVFLLSSQASKRANIAISEANNQAAAATEMAEKIKVTGLELAKQIELAAQQVEETKRENLRLSIELERERLARLKIEQRMAPRYLSTDQVRKLTNGLSSLAGEPVMVTILGDKEAADFGQQILSTVRAAGLIAQVRNIGTMSPPQYGLQIGDSSGKLAKAFSGASIDTARSQSSGQFLTIFVGLKPSN